MDLKTVLTRTPDAAYRIYDGQATIVLPSSAQVNVLNEVGSAVWDAIDGQRTLGDILEKIVEQFETPREQAEKDLLDFVNDLHEKGMVS